MKILIFTFLQFLSSIFNFQVNAQDCNGDVNQRITCYEQNINNLQSSGKTLSNQIAQFDAQIKLTQLKITQTEEQIGLLSGRIDQLEGSLDSLTKAFSERVVETYKMARVEDPLLLILSSNNLSEAFGRFTYLKKIQDADRNLLERLTKAQNTYKEEKVDQEELQSQLETQKKQLNTQKSAKNALLLQTKNDEKKYQSLLSQAIAEKVAIEKALVSGTKVGPVKAGEPIALVGNSGYPGCSTGKHLHFEIRRDNAWTDPAAYMQNKSMIDEQNGGGNIAIGSGNWQWPIQDTIRLTQRYGHTPYSWRYSYSGGIHTGLDMVSTTSDVIRAPSDGTLFKSSESCGSSIINIVYIEHGSGVISFYLHVQ